jgi:hypothetical protein
LRPSDVSLAVTGDAGKRLIDHDDAAGGIGNGDPLAALLEDLGGQIELRRRLLLRADVDDRSEIAGELARARRASRSPPAER